MSKNTPKVKPLSAKSDGQKDYIRSIAENQITICHGLAGTGKTYIPVTMALDWLYRTDKPIEKIVLVRPIVEVGGGMGFYPGTKEEKATEYLIPIIDQIEGHVGKAEYNKLVKDGVIQLTPLPLMRGLNWHNSFIIADEMQSATYNQLVCLLTRFGRDSRMVINGDVKQTDLHLQNGERCPLMHVIDRIRGIAEIGFVELSYEDIVRSDLIGSIIQALN